MNFIKDRLKELATYYDLSIRSFEEKCGLGRGNISNMKDDGALGSDKLSKILDTFPTISPRWLLSGRGAMLADSSEILGKVIDNPTKGVPLIPIEAMAGYFKGEEPINEYECDRVLIPGVKADYVITVRGNSMEPRYHSGDLIACQVLPLSDIFFQWGKAYVVNTDQGVLLKKIKPGSSIDTITLVSENPEYDPFELPRSAIYHVALVTALVRLM